MAYKALAGDSGRVRGCEGAPLLRMRRGNTQPPVIVALPRARSATGGHRLLIIPIAVPKPRLPSCPTLSDVVDAATSCAVLQPVGEGQGFGCLDRVVDPRLDPRHGHSVLEDQVGDVLADRVQLLPDLMCERVSSVDHSSGAFASFSASSQCGGSGPSCWW